MKYLLLGLILSIISVYWLMIHFKYMPKKKENLITDINFKADKANNDWYYCNVGSVPVKSFATYNAATLTPAQKALAERSWPGRPADYYACKQGCEDIGLGRCQKMSPSLMSSNGKLSGWIKPGARKLNSNGIKTNEQNFINKQDMYWDYRKFGKLDKSTNFLKLQVKEPMVGGTELTKELVDNKVTGNAVKGDIAKKIEKCRTLTDCKDLVDNNCGYCWYTNKFQYGDASGPVADVCPKTGWAPPGNKAAYFCEKIREQKICKKVKDCGGTNGEASICGWCPTSGQALVMGDTKDVTENTVYRWKTGSCKPLGGEAGMWCQGGANGTKNRCESPKGSSGNTTYTYTRDYWFWEDPKCPSGTTKYSQHGGWSPWLQHHAHCKHTSPPIPKRVRCYWEEKMNSKIIPKGRRVKWPKYGDDWNKCRNGVSKELVQSEAQFKPGLVPPGECEKFKQEFPCMSPKALTGPHSGACLQSLWKNSGCTGEVRNQIAKSGLNAATEFGWWNSHSFSDAQANMNSYATNADSRNYNKAEMYTKACYNEDVDSCNPRFNPRPKECTQRLYNDMGGKAPGKLNPKNQNKWPNTWVGSRWKQEGTWSTGKYQNEIANTKTLANTTKAMLRQAPRKYDTAARTNMQIYGNKPAPPFAKPCWDDMLDMAKSLKQAGVTISGKAYIDYNKARQFAVVPNTNDINRIKNDELNVYNYRLYKQTFENPNFPYWDAVWKYEDYWKSNWNKFKSILLSVRGVSNGNNYLGISKNLEMASYLPNTNARPKENNISIKVGGRFGDNSATVNCSNTGVHTFTTSRAYSTSSNCEARDSCVVQLNNKCQARIRMRDRCRSVRGNYSFSNYIDAGNSTSKSGCNLTTSGGLSANSVYLTQEEYNKPGFPYAVFINMSQ